MIRPHRTPAGRSSRAHRGGPIVALLAMGALSVPAFVAVAPPVSAQSCGPAPSDRVAVAIVVDDGAATQSQRCVEVVRSATGYDVLIAAGHTLRIESGFLCAIDGVPATGCGNRPDFGGAYWRYFHAPPGGVWTYSTVGGGGYRMPARCAIEGWRFATSATESVTPRIAPPSVTCEAPAVTSPPPTVPPATAAPPAASSGGTPISPGAAPAAGASGTGTGTGNGSGGAGTAAAGAAASAPGTNTAPGATDATGQVAADTPTTSVANAQLAEEQRPREDDGGASAGDGASDGSAGREFAAVASTEQGPGSGSVLGVIFACVMVAVLAVGARRRSRSRIAPSAASVDDVAGRPSREILSEGP